ncbi:hypothetical protein [Pseudomonas sp. BF-B-25]|uniref:hypothetical protein n=1 Tax=Pseudomonas TaxID=286 RepID=UPI001CBBF580|nr:hypothetical protein [Pseudomonas sp. BF-B-25]
MCARLSQYIGILLLISCTSAVADQTETQQLHGAFVSAKISGGCTTLVQMAEFQKSTKMPGGDEFLERFLGMESARLGKSPAQYVQMCADADRVYQFYYKLTSDADG